ncbi:hypothetical protein [Microbacterium sp.]|uniref:hypothetical protein n=1 Tax=Microbacterium sp. TaxID=51671 RepID=UPI0039E276E3
MTTVDCWRHAPSLDTLHTVNLIHQGRSAVRRVGSVVRHPRASLRRALARYGGLPHSVGTIDSPTPETARRVRRLWLRNAFSRAPIVDARAAEVVTMTSYGPRLGDAWVALESIGDGTALPRRIMLWLDAPLDRTPWRLRRLQRRGLEILHTEPGLGVHTKYWPYLTTAALEGPLVTSDDDVLYPAHWLAALRAAHSQEPELVLAHRTKTILMSGPDDFAPYIEWPVTTETLPSYAIFATSVSGQLLPAALQQAIRDDGPGFLDAAPAADDVWIHSAAVRHGYRTRQLTAVAEHWPFVPGSQKVALNYSNVFGGENDPQLRNSHSAATRARIWEDLTRER